MYVIFHSSCFYIYLIQTGRLYIDPNEKNWFLKNRNIWGNEKRVAIVFVAVWLFFFVLAMITAVIDNRFLKRLNVFIMFIIPTIVDIVLYFKFPKFNDHWYILYYTVSEIRFY